MALIGTLWETDCCCQRSARYETQDKTRQQKRSHCVRAADATGQSSRIHEVLPSDEQPESSGVKATLERYVVYGGVGLIEEGDSAVRVVLVVAGDL